MNSIIMVVEELNNFDVDTLSTELLEYYLKKLNWDEEYINTMKDILDILDTILIKNDVRSKSLVWDKEGVKLVDGKVILPSDMVKIIEEIIRENLLYSFFLPEKFGGLGDSGFMIGPLTEKLARYDIPLQMLIMITFTILEPLLIYYRPDFDPIIKEIGEGKRLGYVAFTEPQAGSNLKKVKSTSEKDGEDYILNGRKIFISNGGYANTGLFLAQNIENGKVEGTNVFLIDSLENIDVIRLEEKSGIHANPTAELLFDNVTVPKEYLIASKGDGYRKVLERLLGMRVGVAYQGVAASKRAFELSLLYANTREQFDRPIIQFEEVRRKLEEMKRQIKRFDEYAFRSAFALDRYLRGWIPTDVGAKGKSMAEKAAAKMVPSSVRTGIAHYYASSAKLYITEITQNILYDAVQIHGGMGFVHETEVNKIYRDVRVLPIYEGTSEIHNWILGRSNQAINLLPRFKRPYQEYNNSTIYEKFLFNRFPGLEKKI